MIVFLILAGVLECLAGLLAWGGNASAHEIFGTLLIGFAPLAWGLAGVIERLDPPSSAHLVTKMGRREPSVEESND